MIFEFLPKILLALQTDIGYIGASIVAFIFFLLVFLPLSPRWYRLLKCQQQR